MATKRRVEDCPAADDADVAIEPTVPKQPIWKISLFAFTTKKHILIIFPAILLSMIAGAIRPVLAIFLGYVFEELLSFGAGDSTKSDLLHNVTTWTVAISGVGMATLLTNGAFFSLWLVFGEMQARSVGDMAFLSMLEKDMEWYDLRADGIGSLLIRIQTQVRELQSACSQPLGFFVEVTAAAMAALGIAVYYSWSLALVILACVPITFAVLSVISRRLQPAVEEQKKALNAASKCSYTAIKAVDTVKIFHAQDREIWQYSCAINEAAKSYRIQAHTNAMQMGMTRFMTTAMFVIGFWYGTFLVKKGLSPGRILTSFYSCLMATQAAEQLLPQWLVLTRGMSAAKTLQDIFNQMKWSRAIAKNAIALKPENCRGDVEVSNLTFSYPSARGQPAMHNANFLFPAGEVTFIVGRSGSGKSTVGNLLLKYYRPTSGDIFIDGNQLQTLDVEWLRNNVTLVQQDNVLFNETILGNITLGRQQRTLVSKGDINVACRTAMLHETINDLPNGLMTKVGSEGRFLSGGQKQRVAIARARLRDSPILLLDEATSALDHVSRYTIMEAIRKWRRARTTIIITHDMSEILDADYVYVLDQGQVVQEGYRKHLVEDASGPFASFISAEISEIGKANCDVMAESFLDEQKTSGHLPIAISPSFAVDKPDDEARNRSRPVSRLLGLENELIKKSRPTSSLTYGMGIAHIYTHSLRAKNVWEDASSLSTSRPYRVSVNKPLPALPSPQSPMQFQRPAKFSSNLKPSEFELSNLRAEALRMNRAAINCDNYSTRRHTRATRPASDTVALQAPKFGPDQDQEEIGKRSSLQQRSAPLKFILSTVWPALLWKDRARLILGFIFAFVSAASTPAFSYVLAMLLNTFSMTPSQSDRAEKWALCILCIAVVDGVSTYYMHYFLECCGQIWVDRFRVQALTRILAQPKSWFDKEKNNPGRLNECLDRNAEEMRNLVGRFAGIFFLASSMMSIAIIWAFIVCWKFTLVGLAGGPFMYAFTRAFEAISARWERRINEMAENIFSIFSETFSNIRVVRALTLEQYFKEKHIKAADAAYKTGIRRAICTGLFFGMSDSTNSFVTALVLYYGGVVAASGDWSVRDILLVIALLLFSSGNANSVVTFIPQISSSRTTATCVLDLANMPRKASHESQGTKFLESPLPIKLNSLSFTYPNRPNNEILHKVSMSFEAGSCTTIVGSSGSGKSTIAYLLLGLYPPDEPLHHAIPSLTFASTSVFSCNIPFLRSQIAFVSQSPILFPCAVAENIMYGLRQTSELRSRRNLLAAAHEAGIHDFIMTLPCGYETKIGDGGQGLSGGQAQRICIARALARRPKVLILDEPTSALDRESTGVVCETIRRLVHPCISSTGEDARGPRSYGETNGEWLRIQQALEQRSTNRAVIIITHSAEMMKVADNVVMLENGRVVEQGQFEELYRRRGPFSRLISGGK